MSRNVLLLVCGVVAIVGGYMGLSQTGTPHLVGEVLGAIGVIGGAVIWFAGPRSDGASVE